MTPLPQVTAIGGPPEVVSDVVVSTDVAFDAVRGLRRVGPLDPQALGRLLSAG